MCTAGVHIGAAAMEGCHHARAAGTDPPHGVRGSALRGEGHFLKQNVSHCNSTSLTSAESVLVRDSNESSTLLTGQSAIALLLTLRADAQSLTYSSFRIIA